MNLKEKQKAERIEKMIELRKAKFTYAEIGLEIGVSKQRVKQIGVLLESPFKELFTRKFVKILKEPKVCSLEGCEKTKLYSEKSIEINKTKKFYCSQEHMTLDRQIYSTEEERSAAKKRASHKRYYSDKDAYRKYQAAWRKANPNSKAVLNSRIYGEKWRIRNKVKINKARKKRWHNDPEFRKKMLVYNEEWRQNKIKKLKAQKI